jgi:predicted transcriptional regulator
MLARDVMTTNVVTVGPDAELRTIVRCLIERHISAVPVADGEGRVIGIVSRANLLHGLAAGRATTSADDAAIRRHVLNGAREAGIDDVLINVIVTNGKVDIWGAVRSEAERQALRVAAESAPGVQAVRNQVGVYPSGAMRGGWA